MGRQETLARQIAKERKAVQRRLKRMVLRPTNGFPQLHEPGPGHPGDTLEKVQRKVLEQQEARAYELLVSRARALDQALESLRRGNFGICQLCGAHIPRRRLEAVPDAARCLSCQEKTEQAARNVSTQ